MSQKVVLSFVVVSSNFFAFHFRIYGFFYSSFVLNFSSYICLESRNFCHPNTLQIRKRRFHKKISQQIPNFPESMIRFTHILFASFLSGLILLRLGYIPNTEGMIILALLLLTMMRLFDPILGVLAQPVPASYSSIIGYFVVLTFAISTAVNPDKLDIYHLPINISQGILFALVSYTVLNLRMAYYEKFCFMYEQTLESQLKLILIPLFFLSLHQVMSLLNAADLAIIFPR